MFYYFFSIIYLTKENSTQWKQRGQLEETWTENANQNPAPSLLVADITPKESKCHQENGHGHDKTKNRVTVVLNSTVAI